MDAIKELIIGLEKAALTRWGKGDPDGFLEISAPDVVYFDPFDGSSRASTRSRAGTAPRSAIASQTAAG